MVEIKLWNSKLTNESRPLESDKYGVGIRTMSYLVHAALFDVQSRITLPRYLPT